jgi:hypothetical protein
VGLVRRKKSALLLDRKVASSARVADGQSVDKRRKL